MWHIYKISFLYSFLPPFIKNWPSRLECQKQRELPWEPSITDTAVTVVLPESSHSPSPALGRVHFPTLPFSSAFSLRVDATHPATLAKREWLLIDQRSKWCIRLLQNEGGIGKSIPDSRVGGNLESGRFWWSTGILSSILSFPRKSENPWVFTVLNSILPCLWWKSGWYLSQWI